MVGAEVTRPRGERERERDAWCPWQTTSAVLYSTEDYVAASFRSMES